MRREQAACMRAMYGTQQVPGKREITAAVPTSARGVGNGRRLWFSCQLNDG